MTAAKNVYALMLALVIVLSGCFGNTADDTDAQETGDASDSEMNEMPQVYWRVDGESYDVITYNETTGAEIQTWYFDARWWVSAVDFDGNVTNVGVDTTLDGEIDIQFTTNGTWDVFSYHEGPAGLVAEDLLLADGTCHYRVNLIAIDDDGGTFIHPIAISFNSEC